jgi:chaperonin GroEL (HSP60 family)
MPRKAKWKKTKKTGLRILKRALEAPTRQIAENSALDGGVVVDRMRSGKGNCGLDASSGKFVDLIEAGIIDATKVVRVALESVVSVASTLLPTEATLAPAQRVLRGLSETIGESSIHRRSTRYRKGRLSFPTNRSSRWSRRL